MLHTWVGFRNRLPAADNPGLHTFSLSSVAGSRSGFTGQLWLPLFLEPPSTGARVRGTCRNESLAPKIITAPSKQLIDRYR
jgi:hypothetical protein